MSVSFSPPIGPSVGGAPRVQKPKLYETGLGDGYSQRARAGINHVAINSRVRWDVLTTAQADLIENFFIERGGDQSFTYALPHSSEVLTWRCADWTRSPDTERTEKISANFEQVFDV